MWKQCTPMNHVKHLFLSSSKPLQAPCLVASQIQWFPYLCPTGLTSFSFLLLEHFPFHTLPSLYHFQPNTLKTKNVKFSSNIPSSMKSFPFLTHDESSTFLLNFSVTLSVIPSLQASLIDSLWFLCVSHLRCWKSDLQIFFSF